MDQRRFARKLLLVATLSLLVLALPVIWLAVRLPAPLRAPVRGARAPASLETGSVDAPALPPTGPADSEGVLSDAADPSAGAVSPEIEGTETLSGVVLTPDGAPIAGARVDAERSLEPDPAVARDVRAREETDELLLPRRAGSGHTDARGRFDLGGLAAGYYDLEITARGFGQRSVARAPTHGANSEEGILRIVLHPELFLPGGVVDRRSKPIPGAEVVLTFLAADASDLGPTGGKEGAAHRARTDADGRFRLGGLGRGVYSAEASAAGYSPAIVPLVDVHDPGTAQDLVFELDESLRVRGIVRSAGGGPLAGARVRLLALATRREIEVRSAASGADGAFEFASLPAEKYRLSLSADAHRERTLNVAAGGEAVEVVLEPQVPLEGLVIDRRSGDPVPDAEVRWVTSEGTLTDEEYPAEHTDAAGRFRLERFPEHGEALRIEADGYCTLDVDAAPVEDGSRWTLALARGGTVSGRVRAGRDLPVEGLRVSLLAAPAWPVPAELLEESGRFRRVVASSSTDAAGSYRVSVPGSGTYRVEVEGPPYSVATSEVLTIPDDAAEIDNADIFLELAATARGFVFSRDFGRVSNARVTVIPDTSPEETTELALPVRADAETRADATGAFHVGGLRPGAHRIVAGAPGFVTARSEVFHLAPGGTQVLELELELEMTITGRVVDGDGGSIPMAEIRAVVHGEGAGEVWSEERSRATTAGTFRLSRLQPRPYDLRFVADGFAPAVLWSVAAGRDDVEARLDRLVSLSGRVLGAYTGEPVVVFKLRLRLEEDNRLSALENESLHGWRTFSDPAGAFRIEGLPPGRYVVEALAPGHIGVDDLELEVPIDHGLEDVEVRLAEVGLITGVVVDGDDKAIAGARVEALQRQVDPDRGTVSFRPISLPRAPSDSQGRDSENGGERQRRGRDGDRSPAATRTREDGTFALRGLPDGVYRLSISHDDYLARELGDYVFENGLSGHEPVRLSVLLPFGVVLRGRVRGVAGIESAGANVVLRPVAPEPDFRARRPGRSKSARVDDSGHFEIRGLEVGDYMLQARFRRADGSSISIRRDVSIHGAGREQGILLDLSR